MVWVLEPSEIQGTATSAALGGGGIVEGREENQEERVPLSAAPGED